ncbi:hypothetical protein [Dyella sp.]|uniref:hypothetical protein n=1 Tax=Dyella sp. TaxID=1869338 RepID=UPI002ED55D07
MKSTLLLVGAATLGLAGCGTASQHDTVIKDAVANRVFLYQSPNDGDATLTVTRANGLFGGGCSSRLSIDQKFAADIEIGEQATFHLPNGQHTLALDSSGACQTGPTQMDVSLGAGETHQVAINARGTALSQVDKR